MIAQDVDAPQGVETLFDPELEPSRLSALLKGRTPGRATPRPIHKLKNLHNRRNIDAILHRECARSERNGHEFSLVVLGLADNGSPRQIKRLARHLCQRARATDEIGWFDARRLCVVLPDTNEEGAVSFVRHVTEVANYSGLSPVCNVLCYHGQMHSANEVMNAKQVVLGAEDGDQQQASEDQRRFAAVHLVASRNVSNLLVRPLPWSKRLLDVVVGSTILLLAAPIMLIVAIAIKLSDGGPILFSQRRAGLGGKPFTIYKFRTMVTDAEAKKADLRARSEQDGPAFKIKHDPRITRVGRILRETSLDELPQLFNVLKGDMSLVGPRPLPVEESDRCATWHRRRLDVTPGLTCIWQISGRSSVTFAEWIRMDRRYIRTQSLLHDVKLIIMTVPAMLLRRGR
jgi:lipopolysaccharide/colanic/teichoic acid biosynthesis glycosyltransferase